MDITSSYAYYVCILLSYATRVVLYAAVRRCTRLYVCTMHRVDCSKEGRVLRISWFDFFSAPRARNVLRLAPKGVPGDATSGLSLSLCSLRSFLQ